MTKPYLGFQSESTRHNRDAPIRFKPTPPAFELNKKMTDIHEYMKRAHVVQRTTPVLTAVVEFVHILLALGSGSGAKVLHEGTMREMESRPHPSNRR